MMDEVAGTSAHDCESHQVAEGGEAADATRLDSDTNISPEQDRTLLVPIRTGGRLDQRHGRALRTEDVRRVIHLVDGMDRPHLLTLTIDRSNFDDPESAWQRMGKQFSRLASRELGCKVWCRVLEIQTKTGDGWPHIHALVDLPRGLSLKRARERCWELWRDRWEIGGVDLDRVRSRRGAAKYLAKYIIKGIEVVPPWILNRRTSPRLVGWSRSANDILRAAGLRPARSDGEQVPSNRTYRERRSVLDRLAESGQRTAVILKRACGRTQYLGTLQGCPFLVSSIEAVAHLFRMTRNEYGQLRVEGVGGFSRATVDHIRRLIERSGVAASLEVAAIHRRESIEHGWDLMQDERGRP